MVETNQGETPVGEEWNAPRVSALILLVVICSVLVWYAYVPEDIYLGDLHYEVLHSDRLEPFNDASVSGKTLTLGQTYYPRGIGVHANSEIHVRFLPEGYRFFIAEIGIDKNTPSPEQASVIFSILSDGTLLYESPVIKADMLPRLVRVPIEGRSTITLQVSDAKDGNEGDHANWAMARFVAR